MIGYQLRRASVREMKYSEILPGFDGEDDEILDVSSFNAHPYEIKIEIRPVLRLFGRQVWRGPWRRIQVPA